VKVGGRARGATEVATTWVLHSGAVRTYTLDLYGGLTQVLGDGASVYLYGLGRIGEEGAAGWVTHLGDALGSVRQLADGDGEAVLDRSYRPYGGVLESGGSGGSAYGFAGEWTDGTGLVFLRARYLDPGVGRFVAQDSWKGSPGQSMTLNGYLYADGNPVNRIDPSGLCAVAGTTDCQRFVSEVRCLIEGLRDARECNGWLRIDREENQVLDLLAWYYSGIPFNGLALGWFPRETVFTPGDPDRWAVPAWDQQETPEFTWRHPINRPGSDQGNAMRSDYGFKRPCFQQTHHYFAFLKMAYHWGGPAVEWLHESLEVSRQLQPAIDAWELDNPNYPEYYAWVYRESVYDLYIVHEAAQLAFMITFSGVGVDAIPVVLETWCADSEADVWSLERQVDQFYFRFPEKYWPDERYWPVM
jgi:RHS repeat-associated protein